MRYLLMIVLLTAGALPARADEDACKGLQGCVMVFKIEPGDGVTAAQAKSVAGAVATAVGKVVAGVVETLDAARNRVEAGLERADMRRCDAFSCLQELGNALGDVVKAVTPAAVRPMLTGVSGLVLRAGAPASPAPVGPPAAVSVVPAAPAAADGPGVTFGVQGGTAVRDVGDLLVTGSPAGARVEIRGPVGFNGGRVPATTFPVKLREVPAGEYKLRVTMSGYELWERSVLVAAMDATKVEGVLERSSGTLVVRGTPAGAGVTVSCTGGGGRRSPAAVGLTETGVRFEVPRGPCTVKVGATGWVGYESTLNVAGGGETPVEVRLARVDEAAAGGGGGCPSGWVSIPAGSYDQGCSPVDLHCYGSESPVRRVTISRPLCMKAREVTQGEWKAVSGAVNPSYFQDCGDNCPVEQVDWYSALGYANALSAREGLRKCYRLAGCSDAANGWKDGVHTGCTGATFAGVGNCTGYRLPTEAEWEYAARAGTTGSTYAGTFVAAGESNAPLLDEIAVYGGNSGVSYGGGIDCSGWLEKQYASSSCGSHAVRQKRANPWGLYDMLGNVFEWVWDSPWGTSYSGGAVTDPAPSTAGTKRVARGGSGNYHARLVRVSMRHAVAPDYPGFYIGFRLVRSR